MRPSLAKRFGVVLCGTLAAWLLASAADAAPVARRHARATRSACEQRLAPRTGRACADVPVHRRTTHYFGKTPRLVHRHLTSWLERSRTRPLRDEAVALQNAAAAIGGQDDLLVLASLEPLGVLAAPQCGATVNGAVTPRSPRGPPDVTCPV